MDLFSRLTCFQIAAFKNGSQHPEIRKSIPIPLSQHGQLSAEGHNALSEQLSIFHFVGLLFQKSHISSAPKRLKTLGDLPVQTSFQNLRVGKRKGNYRRPVIGTSTIHTTIKQRQCTERWVPADYQWMRYGFLTRFVDESRNRGSFSSNPLVRRASDRRRAPNRSRTTTVES